MNELTAAVAEISGRLHRSADQVDEQPYGERGRLGGAVRRLNARAAAGRAHAAGHPLTSHRTGRDAPPCH